MVLALLTSSGLCLPGSQVRIRLGLFRLYSTASSGSRRFGQHQQLEMRPAMQNLVLYAEALRTPSPAHGVELSPTLLEADRT